MAATAVAFSSTLREDNRACWPRPTIQKITHQMLGAHGGYRYPVCPFHRTSIKDKMGLQNSETPNSVISRNMKIKCLVFWVISLCKTLELVQNPAKAQKNWCNQFLRSCGSPLYFISLLQFLIVIAGWRGWTNYCWVWQGWASRMPRQILWLRVDFSWLGLELESNLSPLR